MFAFVFIPIVMEQIGSAKVENPVAVKTSAYGDLHERDVRILLDDHRRVAATVTEIMQVAGLSPRYAAMVAQNMFGPAKMENVIDNWLLAQRAEQMGMVISNPAINAWLKMITQDAVSASNLLAIIRHHGFTSDFQFFKLMRGELAAWQMKNMFETSLVPLTPAQRWEYFCRVKQSAAIEAVAVPVANYLKKVDEPSDETLKGFFEQNKEQYPMPDSPAPGFHQPQRVALQYLQANLDKFAAAVTEEEVKAHYEKNKQLYEEAEKKAESRKMVLPGLNLPVVKPEAKKPEPVAKQPKEVKKEEKKEVKPSEKQPPAPQTKEVKPAAPAPQPEKPKQPEPGKQPSKPAKPEDKEKKPAEEKKAKGTSAIEQPSPFRLAALLSDAKPADKADDKAKNAAAAAKPAAAKPEVKPAAPAKAPAPPAKPSTPSATVPAGANPAKPASAAASPAPAAAAKPVETKPAGPSDAIKRRIRQELAMQKITKIYDGLRGKMDDYRRLRSAYDVAMIHGHNKNGEATANQSLPPLPPALDFEKLAQQNGLTFGKTTLMAQWELQATPIGASFVGMRDIVARYAMTLHTFHPAESMNLEGDRYLFWATEESKDRVPEFTEKGEREVVLRAWKMLNGRPLATKAADVLADEARKANKPLKQVFADRPDLHVAMPPAFSWITFGNVALGSSPGATRLSTPAGIDLPGDAFMRTVFRLEPGQVGVAMNAPQTVAYVIRLDQLTPSHDVLWKQFEVDDFSKYASAAIGEQRQILQAWLNELKTSANLQWKQKPEQMQESGPQQQEEE
jgi:hypothetical protein